MHCLDDFPVPLIQIAETNSTNSYLQALCAEQKIDEFTTVLADFQTAGRGQRGNSWESDKKKNLLFSFVIYPEFLQAKHQFLISQIISLAIKDELAHYAPDGISIKWPNDIYWKEKKIGGMLIENDLMGQSICQSIAGIGININQEAFHSPAPNPVSLYEITGKEYNLPELLGQLMTRIKNYYRMLQQGESALIATRYEEALFRRKGLHLYSDSEGEFLAEIIGIEPDGHLVMKKSTGETRKYAFKEIQYLLK